MDLFQHINLALEGAHSTLKIYQDGKNLAKRCVQVLEEPSSCWKKLENTTKNNQYRKMQREVCGGPKGVVNVKNFTLPKSVYPKSMSKFASPYSIVERVFKDMYKLDFLSKSKVHPTFHVSLLKPCKKTHYGPITSK